MKLRELTEIQRPQYNPEPRYTLYRKMPHIPFHDSGVPMGEELPKKAFIKGVPGKHVQDFLNKLNSLDDKEEFTAEIEEGAAELLTHVKSQLTPRAIAGAAALSLAGNAVAKGVERVGKEVVDDEDDEWHLHETPDDEAGHRRSLPTGPRPTRR